jgi:transposase
MSKDSMACAGIDTGKRKLDVALDGSKKRLQVDNTAEGHEVLSAWLRQYRIKRVGIEASGGYEQAIVATLRKDHFGSSYSNLRRCGRMPSSICSAPRMTRSMRH